MPRRPYSPASIRPLPLEGTKAASTGTTAAPANDNAPPLGNRLRFFALVAAVAALVAILAGMILA